MRQDSYTIWQKPNLPNQGNFYGDHAELPNRNLKNLLEGWLLCYDILTSHPANIGTATHPISSGNIGKWRSEIFFGWKYYSIINCSLRIFVMLTPLVLQSIQLRTLGHSREPVITNRWLVTANRKRLSPALLKCLKWKIQNVYLPSSHFLLKHIPFIASHWWHHLRKWCHSCKFSSRHRIDCNFSSARRRCFIYWLSSGTELVRMNLLWSLVIALAAGTGFSENLPRNLRFFA